MKKSFFVLLALLSLSIVLPRFDQAEATVAYGPLSFADIAEKYGPTVVNIYSTQIIKGGNLPYNFFYDNEGIPEFFRRFFDLPQGPGGTPPYHRSLPEQKRTSLGSGVIISQDGYILTNNHVVENADEINVRLADYEEYQAKIIGRDPKTDLALIKIEPKHDLPFAEFGDSDTLRVGDWVIAIGNPFGFEQTVTAGIVSGKGRTIGDGVYQNFIQTDASINPGNSGGPLFNMEGKLMGINTAIYSRSGGNIGLGFAIPSNMAKGVADQLRGEGKVTRGMLGVMIQPVTRDLAEQFGLDRPVGALIAQVVPDSPAEKAGIRPGDIILKYQGKDVSRINTLPALVAQTPIDTKATVTLFRDGKTKTVEVVIAKLPEDDDSGPAAKGSDAVHSKDLGMTLQELTPELAESLGLFVERGLLVTEVVPGGAAAAAGLKRGNVILEVGVGRDRRKVKTVKQFNKLVDQHKRGSLLLLIKDGRQTRFVLLKTKSGE